MEEDESTTPTESDNEPYICSLRVGGKFQFLPRDMYEKKILSTYVLEKFLCESVTLKIYFLKLFLSICLK